MTIALRRADAGDSDLVFQWVNRADSLSGKLRTQQPISREAHERWFTARLADSDTLLWIIESKSEPVGQLRLTRRDAFYEIDIYVEASTRRTGVAHTALQLGIAELTKSREGRTTLRALIKRSNMASQRFFERERFGLSDEYPDHLVYDLTVP